MELAMRGATSFISVTWRSVCSLPRCIVLFLLCRAWHSLSTTVLMARNNSRRLDLVMARGGLMTVKVLFHCAHLPECCSPYGNKQQKKPHLRFAGTLQFCKHAATPLSGAPLVVPGYDDVYLMGIRIHVPDGAGMQLMFFRHIAARVLSRRVFHSCSSRFRLSIRRHGDNPPPSRRRHGASKNVQLKTLINKG